MLLFFFLFSIFEVILSIIFLIDVTKNVIIVGLSPEPLSFFNQQKKTPISNVFERYNVNNRWCWSKLLFYFIFIDLQTIQTNEIMRFIDWHLSFGIQLFKVFFRKIFIFMSEKSRFWKTKPAIFKAQTFIMIYFMKI